MSIAIKGLDGNAFGSRDVVGNDNNFVTAKGQLTFTGTYIDVAAGGDPVDFTAISQYLASSLAPLTLFAYSIAGVTSRYLFVPGATQANGYLKITGATGTEVANGAAYTADTVVFEATFRKLL